ncbi:hypothetical protein ZWY2020_026527 [Hordeum vulgare]|nr:hypothetical protein ZWY2020_026527 [Hordeum vulgare]
MANWSSLPSDLIHRVADYLLATNDVDCYMDFRAVCTNWRSATDDPKSSELRFCPCQWIIIDEVFQSDARLLVNTSTGRVVRKELPLLHNFHVVATTHGGFFVLSQKKAPHATCVLNPFTGHMIRFMAPLTFEMTVSAAAVAGPSPNLILLDHRDWRQYMADPVTDTFVACKDYADTYFSNWRAIVGGMYAGGKQTTVSSIPVGLASELSNLMTMFGAGAPDVFSDVPEMPSTTLVLDEDCCFVVELAGETFIVVNLRQQMVVFKLNTDSDVLEPMKSIGSLAIFVGCRRCFAVNAQKFPSIDANSIYYVGSMDSSLQI